jgi:ribonuclease R
MGGKKSFIGPISMSARGVGYFSIEGIDEDIEIAPPLANTALHNDEVEIELLPAQEGIRQQGKVTEIIKRAKTQFVGTLVAPASQGSTLSNNSQGRTLKTPDFFFLKPDDRRMYKDIFIHKSNALGAKDGDKVLAEMTGWKDPMKGPDGKVLRVLGKKGVHNVEMQAILLEKGFDTDFPQNVEAEAKKIALDFTKTVSEEIKKRRDMRDTLTFTIDPADAKDFDDAISFKQIDGGLYEIGIHIADVSHYVLEGSELDREAIKRGTSVYLVDRTIPMLPEVFSNDLCSLNPNEDKFTFSAIFITDKNGQVKERWFGKTVINSDKRFTYEEAQEILDAKKGLYFEELNKLNETAKILKEEKFKNGAIEFESDEVKFVLDENGKPISVYRKERKDTHKLVEEYMLLANREVAHFMSLETEKMKGKGAFVYRIHDLPDKDKIVNLNIFLKALGYDLHAEDGEVTASELNTLLKQVEGKPEESLIKTAAIRSMAKAVYSTKNIGHFGLGFEYYTHFTSPIRRYPDVMVHRLLYRFLEKGRIGQDEIAKYQKLCDDATEKEIAAADAERASIKYKQVEFMLSHVGEEFTGTVSGVSEWGIYIEEEETHAEGMVRLKNMTDDFYTLDGKNYAIVGTNSKKKFTLGDKVRVKLLLADLDKRILDYVFV